MSPVVKVSFTMIHVNVMTHAVYTSSRLALELSSLKALYIMTIH